MVENLEKKEEADKKTFKETQNLYSLSLSRSREDVLISNNNVDIEKNVKKTNFKILRSIRRAVVLKQS